MAEGNGAVYNKAKERFFLGEIDLVDDVLDLLLMEGYTPDIDAHEDWTDVSAQEASGTGYDAGGKTFSNKTVDFDSGTDVCTFDSTDAPTWTGLDCGTPSHAILMDNTHASDALVLYWELGRASNGGDYGVTYHGDGILTLT